MYNTSTAEQIRHLLADSGAKIAVTQAAFLPLLKEAAAGTAVGTIVVVDGDAEGTISLAELEAKTPAGFDFEATWRAVRPDALLTIIYTSGTTGAPKGVEITHANMMFELRSFFAVGRGHTDSRVISFLPHAHIADRMATHYLAMCMGMQVTACPDPRQLFEHVPDAKPTEFTGVPRVWEKLKAGLEARFAGEEAPKKAAIKGAIEASLAKVRLEQAGQPVPPELAAGVARAEQMMFAPLRAALGLDQARAYFVGAAPTPREVLEFFHALGMPIAEVWGMSELSCVATAMPPDRIKIGSVGKAMPGVELRIADDGEVLVRGPLVMKGYRNLPQQTAETIDPDGWLHTGDIGELDAEGFLKIVDRKKELIINAAGKNMSPANIEARIKTSSPLIGQAVVIGDGRPYNVALLVLDPDGSAAFAKARGLTAPPAQLVDHPDVKAELDRAIASANTHLARVEQIKRFTLLTSEWLPGGDELTPTMKLRRKPIAQKYAAEIEALYAGAESGDDSLRA
jgi:long-subunit acyl-CoA synthetase (AMP-forming)